MKKMTIMLAACALMLPSASHAQGSQDAVEIMMQEYNTAFRGLPKWRKCKPEDAKGMWVERGTLEAGKITTPDIEPRKTTGHIAFGPYNTLLRLEGEGKMTQAQLTPMLETTKLQYIMTVAGMFYVYMDNKLQTSQLCTISTEATREYPAGMLMLATPVEKNKPISLTMYTPVEK